MMDFWLVGRPPPATTSRSSPEKRVVRTAANSSESGRAVRWQFILAPPRRRLLTYSRRHLFPAGRRALRPIWHQKTAI